jgi:hypothetical protein
MAAGQTRPAADLILTHAKVWTVDKSRPTAEAVAVLGERIEQSRSLHSPSVRPASGTPSDSVGMTIQWEQVRHG